MDDQARRCYNDFQEATERGAYGIAILIARQLYITVPRAASFAVTFKVGASRQLILRGYPWEKG